MPWLVALDGGLAGRRFALDATFLVGRGPFNHVVLDDVRISRHHAKVAAESEGHVVYDLGSANGSFVNDKGVKRHVLTAGDLVRFGPFRFRFEPDPVERSTPTGRRNSRTQELTTVGFDAPSKIVGHTNAQEHVTHTLITTGGLADLEDAHRRLRTLFNFVQGIAATLDDAALLDLIVANLLDAFPAAALAAVYTLDEVTSTMDPRRVVARDGREVPRYPLPADLYLEVVQRGKAVLSTPLSIDGDDDRIPGPATMMHAPMVYRGAVLGVLNVRCERGAMFIQGDLDLLIVLASHAALALQNSWLHRQSLEQQRMQRDLALAQQIQKSFLPLALPEVRGVEFVAEYQPAHTVGGDFYDVFWLSHDRIGSVIGDVSGKGVAAALLMARVSSDLRTALSTEGGPALALSRVNRDLVARGQSDIFVTAVAMTLHVPTRTLTLSNAGHMPPYVRHVRPGDLLRIDGASSCPLGIFADVSYDQVTMRLAPGDTVVLTTDGVHEATDERGRQLGFEGLEPALREGTSSARALAQQVLRTVRAHVKSAPRYDDLTLLLCGITE
ncbi:MAG: SpoIIE family protein phosphatase [Polyangiaceae bacterium]